LKKGRKAQSTDFEATLRMDYAHCQSNHVAVKAQPARSGYDDWLDKGISYGTAPYRLLKAIEELGSLNRAAKMTGISFRTAWRVLDTFERTVGVSLVERKKGGVSGGGSKLTVSGQKFVTHYEQFCGEIAEAFEALFTKYFVA
jgi:molybdate transport system regulatory protein